MAAQPPDRRLTFSILKEETDRPFCKLDIDFGADPTSQIPGEIQQLGPEDGHLDPDRELLGIHVPEHLYLAVRVFFFHASFPALLLWQ